MHIGGHHFPLKKTFFSTDPYYKTTVIRTEGGINETHPEVMTPRCQTIQQYDVLTTGALIAATEQSAGSSNPVVF